MAWRFQEQSRGVEGLAPFWRGGSAGGGRFLLPRCPALDPIPGQAALSLICFVYLSSVGQGPGV